jgi:hypothetical protein
LVEKVPSFSGELLKRGFVEACEDAATLLVIGSD